MFLPFVGQGARVEVLGLSLSVAGLWGAWNILVKGTLGVAATVVLAATTTVPELLQALERLRVPTVFVAITAFMIRYGDVISRRAAADADRPGSRGSDPRWLWQARAVADIGRRAVRPLLRARRAGPPGDGVARLRRPMPVTRRTSAPRRAVATGRMLPGRRR